MDIETRLESLEKKLRLHKRRGKRRYGPGSKYPMGLALRLKSVCARPSPGPIITGRPDSILMP